MPNLIDLVCVICDKEFKRKKYEYDRRLRRNPNTQSCCNRKCQIILRARRGGEALKSTPEEYIPRFWSMFNKILDKDSCWEWQGFTSKKSGYGRMSINGKIYSIHRLSYEFINKVILLPEDNICHKCDNRRCGRPSHLFKGTQQDNLKDCFNKGRHARGEVNGHSILTDNDILDILFLFYEESLTQKLISKLYKIDPSQISEIVNNKAWRHIKDKYRNPLLSKE